MVVMGWSATPASALTVSLPMYGAETNARTAETSGGSNGVFLSATSVYDIDGGQGDVYAYSSQSDSRGNAQALADIDGVINGDAPSPILKSESYAGGDGVGASSAAGVMVQYEYNGASPSLITYSFTVTADVNEPNPSTTSAFMRSAVGIVTLASSYNTDVDEFLEGGGQLRDSDEMTWNTTADVDYSQNISFTANPGETFWVVARLNTQAGGINAYADAFSTLQGQLTTGTGTITIVPEPATGALLIGGMALMLRRRR